jgi:hypothetical protein
MWNMKCMIIPVMFGGTGTVTKGLKKNLETILGKHSTDSLNKTAILGTTHTIRKILQCETWSLSGGGHRCFKRRSASEKRRVTTDVIIIIIIIIIIRLSQTSISATMSLNTRIAAAPVSDISQMAVS